MTPTYQTYQSRRFYHYSSSHSQNPLRDPAEQYDRIWTRERAALDDSRTTASNTIAECYRVLTTLELARLTATRMGTSIWLGFWNRMYPPIASRLLNVYVSQAVRRINTLFRNTADRLRDMLAQRQNDIRYAATTAQITWELQIMEEYAIWYRDRRRRKAQRIMDKLQSNIQNGLGLRVPPQKMIDMKRGIFGLDPICDYYPHRLDSGHTAVYLPFMIEAGPPLVETPTAVRRHPMYTFYDGQWWEVPIGFCPVDGYEIDSSVLI